MAKSETQRVFAVNTAQKYLVANGVAVGTQQVRNLMRTNAIVNAGVQDRTDEVRDETYKVITQSALDEYIVWKRANPEVARGGRRSDGLKKYSGRFTADQIASINALLSANGFTPLEIPVPVKRGPRKVKNADATAPLNGFESVSSDVDLSELELIEVA